MFIFVVLAEEMSRLLQVETRHVEPATGARPHAA